MSPRKGRGAGTNGNGVGTNGDGTGLTDDQLASLELEEEFDEELEFAMRIFRAHPQWPVIDVTGRAIEETAVIILESLKEKDEQAKNARAAIV